MRAASPKPPADLPPESYSLDKKFVARFFKVSLPTVDRWVIRKSGPAFRKIGGKLVRFSLRDLLAWAEQQPGGGTQ